ncbi:galactokinase [Nesterenkonia xinjiangensis]|uniref:Galactokinase n=1 Tax=Nesterenkonia xinjiangensis TaxID=225327 RepID=A0A7Z0GMX4_9MICC|nr:galactokinase [Nesterenkonia xinjiangensis]
MNQQDDRVRAQALQSGFREVFGQDPDGVWAAPGRVNLIGEHTDYNEGFVLPFALPQSTYVAARRRSDGQVRVHSLFTEETAEFALEGLRPGSVDGWAAYVAGMCWGLREADVAVVGVDLLIDSTVPHGAGLSSSAALECSVGLAVVELSGTVLEPLALARIAQRVENDFVGMPCGLMDQMISMLGEAGHAVLFDTRSLTPTLVPLAPTGDAEVLVIDTRAPHRLVDGEYAERRRQCEEAADALGVTSLRELSDTETEVAELLAPLTDETLRRRARHVITENRRVSEAVALLRDGDLAAVGERMRGSHLSLRDDYEVTVPEIDLAFDVVSGAGVLGARITGGGFGGCVIALAPLGVHQQVEEAVTAAFAEAGFSAPAVFRAPPADGARRVL